LIKELNEFRTGVTARYTSGTNQFVDDIVISYNYIVDNGADIDNCKL